jgi:hypothetical protein
MGAEIGGEPLEPSCVLRLCVAIAPSVGDRDAQAIFDDGLDVPFLWPLGGFL